MSPQDVTGAQFESKLRGVDPVAVHAHLRVVADAMAGLQRDNDALRAELDRVRSDIAEMEIPAPVAEAMVLDEEALTEQLGAEAGRVLTEARAAAADRLAEAEAEAADIRAAAEALHAERSRAADVEAHRLRAATLAELEELRAAAASDVDTAREQAQAVRESATTEVDASRQSADAESARLIREAELARRQILEDLARRRSMARKQIEQLRAGRERLMASHEVVRRALDEISEELMISMSEARAAAETAGHSVSESTVEELEAEIETARITGLLDTGPLPVVRLDETSERSAPGQRPLATGPTDEETTAGTASVEAEAVEDLAVEGEVAGDEAEVDEVADEPADASGVAEPDAGDEDVTAEEASTADAAAIADDDQASDAVSGDTGEPIDIPDSDESSDVGDASPSPSPDDPDGPLAPVLQLDRRREDVDTRSHPAAGRDAASSKARPSENATDNDESSSQSEESGSAPASADETSGLSIVASEPDDESPATDEVVDEGDVADGAPANSEVITTGDEVDEHEAGDLDDLFARMRSDSPPATEVPESAPAPASADRDVPAEPSDGPSGGSEEPPAGRSEPVEESDESSTESSGAGAGVGEPQPAEEMTVPTDPADIDDAAGDLSRRLKRVLADEQSTVLASLKQSSDMPALADLLGGIGDHCQLYRNEIDTTVGELADTPDIAASELDDAADDFLRALRHRVQVGLDAADGDTESAIAAMRGLYRETKTARIPEFARRVCEIVVDSSSS